MKVSAIIPTRDRLHHLKTCIKSIESQTEKPDEVVIIVHKEDIKTKDFIKNLESNLRISYFETDGGTCKGRNLGIKSSNGEVLVFIEDDVILEDKYIENVKKIFLDNSIFVIAGYTFDILDLTTPWFMRKGEIEYINENRNDEFFQMIINERSKWGYTDSIKRKFIFYNLTRKLRNFFKLLILQEGIRKGRILPSGYRSEMPDIKDINGLNEVEWVNGGNFAIRKSVAQNFKFNEDMETLDYVLGEDLEFSARVGKKYDIFISSDLKLLHLRAPTGIKINKKERFMSMVINFRRIANIRGNKLAYWWSVIGLTISRVLLIPFYYHDSVSEIKGISEGINYLENLDE